MLIYDVGKRRFLEFFFININGNIMNSKINDLLPSVHTRSCGKCFEFDHVVAGMFWLRTECMY